MKFAISQSPWRRIVPAQNLLKMEKQNRQISLPTDTTAEILRHLSRRKLSQDLYLVNRNIWQVATSSQLVPNVHLIKELYIDTRDMQRRYTVGDIQEHVSHFDPDTNSGYGNLIGIHNNSEHYRFPVSYFIQKMPTPEPFVRFSNVRIEHCEDESLIEFLSNAKESFVGYSISNDAVNKLAYLIGNAFIRAKKIAINEVKLPSPSNFNYTQELHCALLNWLHDDGSERSTLVQRESKHLVLAEYPREMILDMVEHVKQTFKDENLPPAAFLITFFFQSKYPFGKYPFTPRLEGEHDFSLTNNAGEKLSFFKTRYGKDYQLYRRKVLNKALDWVDVVSGHSRRAITSLPTDTTADILRHLSRKKLSRDLYLVNRNIWQIATSRHLVPNVHLIKELYIDTRDMQQRYTSDDIQEHVRDFDPETNFGFGNMIRIYNNLECYRLPVSYFIQKMPTPGPFVRFGGVLIQRCEDESVIEFLCNAKESFVGCDVKIDFHDSLDNGVQKKLAYLLSNAFIRPATILIDVKCGSGLQQILRTEGVSNCNKLEFCLNDGLYCTQQFHSALLNWLHNYGREEKRMIKAESKFLVLDNYPEKMILNMVEHLKQAFQDDTSPPSTFLITFHVPAPNLDGEHLNFLLSKVHTGEKFSFFKGKERHRTFVYRLWRRRVVDKRVDRMMEWQYKHTNLYQTIYH
ncbi:hypothetical protein Ddc_15845 [Ditylenchus destructor]|nr:hypothetical protein Ddc_15845 [Ditylenchus destructor]